ncbi:hypothetical protein J6590_037818 [Homalodisca vitripennis]|nr:hypothetical protein J6590_037818 [Homalodisca vitripennis]
MFNRPEIIDAANQGVFGWAESPVWELDTWTHEPCDELHFTPPTPPPPPPPVTSIALQLLYKKFSKKLSEICDQIIRFVTRINE